MGTAALKRNESLVPAQLGPKSNHAELASQYASDIISGKVPAGSWVIKAAKRHLSDLEKSATDHYPYYFDAEKGARVCRFIELFPHVKGQWAKDKKKLTLSPWQCFLVVVLFGWLRRDSHLRRFREAYWCIPRKNGKSTLAAGIGLYMFAADGEFGAEVFSGATTEKQAWEVFRPARMMAYSTLAYQKKYDVQVWSKHLLRTQDASRFEPIIGNPGDGSSPSCAIVDEFHEHDTPALYDTMNTGMGARTQPLMLLITTAGYNIAGPCYEKQDDAMKVLNDVLENDELFAVIFGIDEKDDWADPKSLIKANPNYGISVDGEYLMAQQRAAMANPIYQNKFKTKHLNIWCSVLSGIMNMQQWALWSDPDLDEDDLVGTDCWFAIDLASKCDLCTEQRLYKKNLPNQSKPHFYLFGSYWLPEDTIDEEGPNHAHYLKWVHQGFLTPTPGATIDFELITEKVKDDCAKFNPQEVVYDPYLATQFANALMEEKIKVVEFLQTPVNFAVPVDELNAAIKDGRFHHDGNPITKWCFSNTCARPARKGLVAPAKQKNKDHQKIDGSVATYMALARAVAGKAKERAYQMISL